MLNNSVISMAYGCSDQGDSWICWLYDNGRGKNKGYAEQADWPAAGTREFIVPVEKSIY